MLWAQLKTASPSCSQIYPTTMLHLPRKKCPSKTAPPRARKASFRRRSKSSRKQSRRPQSPSLPTSSSCRRIGRRCRRRTPTSPRWRSPTWWGRFGTACRPLTSRSISSSTAKTWRDTTRASRKNDAHSSILDILLDFNNWWKSPVAYEFTAQITNADIALLRP